jgi:hypothetical protein
VLHGGNHSAVQDMVTDGVVPGQHLAAHPSMHSSVGGSGVVASMPSHG